MPDPIEVLSLTPLPPQVRAAIEQRYALTFATDGVLEGQGARAVITNGSRGVSAQQIAALPNLAVIATIGVGAEAVDEAAARRRGIPVVTGRGTLEDGVADHALALLLALAREIPAFDEAVRGRLPRPNRTPVSLTGKRLGILGLGEIGQRIAIRAEAFGLIVGYHNRAPRARIPYVYYEDALTLAEESDFIVIAAPGGDETRHLVDADFLVALGTTGRLVNIGRGSIVDTKALIDALEDGVIAGAALDVFEGEPQPSPRLAAAPNLILTPHIAALSPERIAAMGRRLLETLDATFASQTPALEGFHS